MEGSESYKRLLKHPQNGKIFLPINIDGVEQSDHFMTIPKLIALGASGVLLVLIIANASRGGINIFLGIFLWLIITMYLFRYVVFEEKRYYKAYLQTKKVEVCTPAEFFKITAVRETPVGSIIMFNNGQVGVLVKLERGTVVGRPTDFMGEHYDAMSEMFRALLKANLKFLLMDVCESTGNESTVDALGRLTVNSTNKNINKLMELQVGFIKNIVNDTIYSKEYILVYTDASRIGTLIAETEEALNLALEGAIDGYEILDQNGISTFVSEYFGVGYFSGEDVLRAGVIRKAFKIVGVEYADGVRISIGDEERKKIEMQVKGIEEGKFTARQVSLRRALAAKSDADDGVTGFITDIPQATTGVLFDATQNALNPLQGDFGSEEYNYTKNQFGGFTEGSGAFQGTFEQGEYPNQFGQQIPSGFGQLQGNNIQQPVSGFGQHQYPAQGTFQGFPPQNNT